MRSIRTRITLAVVGCTALAVAIAALVVGFTGRKMLFDALDERLTARARFFAVTPRWNEFRRDNVATANPQDAGANSDGVGADRGGSDRTAGTPRDGRDAGTGRGGPSGWHLIVDRADQTEISRYGSELPEGFSLANVGLTPGAKPVDVELDDGRTLRAYAFESTTVAPRWRGRGGDSNTTHASGTSTTPAPATDGAATPTTAPVVSPPDVSATDAAREDRRPAITFLASDATDTHAEANRLAGLLAAAWAAATALAFVLSRGTARAVLAPVANLSQRIESLSPQNLSARVPMDEVPAELSAVIARLNALLTRVESAFERERATIANMAHELRTPISAMRTELEFAQFRSDTLPQDQRTMEKSLALAVRMQSLVNSLLTMSRIESGQETLATGAVDVVRVLREAWSTVEARAAERGFAPRFSGCESIQITSSVPHLAMVAMNLLDNAVSHGAPGDVDVVIAKVTAEPSGDRVQLQVGNRCDPAHPAADKLFEPFWRSDPARTGERHFGLGLALCARVVKLLGGTIEAEQDEGRFCVTVELPIGEPPAATTGTPAAMASSTAIAASSATPRTVRR